MSVEESIPESDRQMVEEAAAKLMENFDSVRIFVTKHDGGREATAAFDTGAGNFYAQLGQVSEWLCIQKQYQVNWAIRNDDQ